MIQERPGQIEPLVPPDNAQLERDVPNWARENWLRDGYVVLPSVYSRDRIAEYNRVVAEERLSVAEDKDEFGYGDRLGQLHQKHPQLLDLASDSTMLKFLRYAFGDEPVVFGSLNFERSTEQGAHIDAIFFYPQPVYSMAGCWVALEDVHPDSGPLFYVPGSHRWPFSNGEDVVAGRPELAAQREAVRRQPDSPDQGEVLRTLSDTWSADFAAMQKANGMGQVTLLPKAGDVVIWHSLLAHGGSPRTNRSLSRRSVVFHYIGAKTALYTYGQFFFKNRNEIPYEPPQPMTLKNYKTVCYMSYGFYVSYKGGQQQVHTLEESARAGG